MDQDTFAVRLIQMIKMKTLTKYRPLIFKLDIVLSLLIVVCISVKSPPAKVSALEITKTTYNSAALKWQKADKADGYHIYRSEDGEKYEYIGSSRSADFIDTDLKTGSVYQYKVSAYSGVRNGEENKDPVTAEPSLDKPKLKVDTSEGQVELDIAAVDGATGYEIFRDGEKISSQAETTYIDEEAQGDESHSYEVRAERVETESESEDEPVYSDFSKPAEATLISAGKLSAEVDGNNIHLIWDGNEEYSTYKIFDGKDILTKTESTEYVLEDPEINRTYDLRLIGYGEDIESPEETFRFSISEEPLETEDAVNAACDWGVEIAEDNSFNYGTGDRAHRNGCYFCGTNTGPVKNIKGRSRVKGHSYEKTYCCNTFVTACFAHGAGDPGALALCEKGNSIDMTEASFMKSGEWDALGKPSMANLERGDVLVGNRNIGSSKSHHMAIYIGDGKIVQAKRSGWDAESINVQDLSSRRYGKFDFVMRYQGTGSGTKLVIHELNDDHADTAQAQGQKSESQKADDSE